MISSIKDDSRDPSALVLLRPFKLLVKYEKEIRESFGELEASIAAKEPGLDESNDNTQGVKQRKGRRSRYTDDTLLTDLKLLIEFLDVDLKRTFEMREKIRDGTLDSIEYADLWHLFQIGENVIFQPSIPNVLRVTKTTVSTTNCVK